MMNCEVIQDLLPLYLDDACGGESRQLVEEHLEKCGECRRKVELMKKEMEIEADFTGENLEEEKLLRIGKENIEKKAKKDILVKATYVDLLLNVLLLIFSVLNIWKKAAYGPVFLAEVFSIGGGGLLPAAVLVFLVCQVIFLVKDSRNKETFVSQMMSGASVFLKMGVLVMLLVVGIAVILTGAK